MHSKPATALADPYPAPTPIPAHTVADDGADYESELAVVLGRAARDVAEADAAACVLGYTAANDVSSRPAQLRTSQWCYAKGFDGSCPLGPVLVAARAVPDVGRLRLRGRKNGTVVQDERLECVAPMGWFPLGRTTADDARSDLIFSVPKLVSFLSQGTTLPRGTVILTGTPAGVGMARGEYLHDGDEFVVEITPHIGSLVNVFRAEKK